MRNRSSSLLLLGVLSLALAGCLGEYVPGPTPAPPQPTTTNPTPASMPPTVDGGSSPTDLGSVAVSDGGANGAAPFGATCSTGTDCQSGVCQQVNMGLHCTVVCTNLDAADSACPLPGGSGNGGQCNQNGYCKVQ